MIEQIIQVMIAVTGCLSLCLVTRENQKLNKWAPVVGLIGQPFWLYTSFIEGEWGIFILSVVYTLIWFDSLRKNWFQLP